jgi:hypothetical protein
LKDLLINAFVSVGLTTAVLLAAGRFLGERLFGHWLDGRLQGQKEAHELRLAELKNEQDRQIETLRADIGHLQDRGKHSNEREYAALSGIWEKFTMFHEAAGNYVRGLGPEASAQRAWVEFQALFDTQNIFIPKSLADSFDEAMDQCTAAIALRKADEAGRRPADITGVNGFVATDRQMFRTLNDAVRERLHRE